MKNRLRWLLLVICAAAFCYSAYMLLSTLFEYKKADNFYDLTADQFVTAVPSAPSLPAQAPSDALPDLTASAPAAPIPSAQEQEAPAYRSPVLIDFSSLLELNGDVVGWLYCEDSVINYPIARGKDNYEYLHHMLDGSYNSSGTLFMDYRCAADFSSDNSLIYGHNMKNGAMFHCLPEYRDPDYYAAHPVMYLLTPEQNYVMHIVAGFITIADSWVYQYELTEDGAREAFLNQCISNSDFRPEYTPGEDDLLVTLSTCTYEYNNARYVIIGALVPIE